MSSPVYVEIQTPNMISKIEAAVKRCKDYINCQEANRVISMLDTLKSDEDRVSECIDDIEDFHREMFLLPYKKNKPADIEATLESYMAGSDYSVTEPVCSGNDTNSQCMVNDSEIIVSRNEPDVLINEENLSSDEQDFSMDMEDLPKSDPDCSINEQKSLRPSLILKIPRSQNSFNKISDDNDSRFSKNELGDGMGESSGGISESSGGMGEPSDGMGEPSGGMGEPSNDEYEKSKKVILDLLLPEEKEMTELILHLIHTFSCFQRKLRAAEVSVSQPLNFFPDKPKNDVRKTLRSLTGTVLYLDKIVDKILAKYSEMLQGLGEIFQDIE